MIAIVNADLKVNIVFGVNELNETKSFQMLADDNQMAKPPKAPVEIFIGSKKLKLNDLLIIDEESDDEDRSFEGFLQNLGKTITVSFVRRPPKKPQTIIESDCSIIENVPLGEVLWKTGN